MSQETIEAVSDPRCQFNKWKQSEDFEDPAKKTELLRETISYSKYKEISIGPLVWSYNLGDMQKNPLVEVGWV